LRVINYLEYTPGIPLTLIGTASAACDPSDRPYGIPSQSSSLWNVVRLW